MINDCLEVAADRQDWSRVDLLLDIADRFTLKVAPAAVGRAVRGLAKDGHRSTALDLAIGRGVTTPAVFDAMLAADVSVGDKAHAIAVVSAMVAAGTQPGLPQLRSVASLYVDNLSTVGTTFDLLARRLVDPRRQNQRLRGMFVLAVGTAFVRARMVSNLGTLLNGFVGWTPGIEPADIRLAIIDVAEAEPEGTTALLALLEDMGPIDTRTFAALALGLAHAARPDLVKKWAPRAAPASTAECWDYSELALEYRLLRDGTPIDKQVYFTRPKRIAPLGAERAARELELLRAARTKPAPSRQAWVIRQITKLKDPPLPLLAVQAVLSFADDGAAVERLFALGAGARANTMDFRNLRLTALQAVGVEPTSQPFFAAVRSGVEPSRTEIAWFASAAFPALAERRLFEAALDATGRSPEAVPMNVYRSAAKALGASGAVDRLDRLDQLIADFANAGADPDGRVWLALIKSCDDVERAEALLAEMPNRGFDTDLDHVVAVAQVHARQPDLRPLRLFVLEQAESRPAHATIRLFAIAVQAFLRASDVDGAKEFLDLAAKQDLELGPSVRRSVIAARRQAHQIDDEEMRAEFSRVDASTSLDRADQLQHTVHDLANVIGPLFQNLKEFGVAVRAGDLDDALALASSAQATSSQLENLIGHWRLVAAPPTEAGDDDRVSVMWVMRSIEKLLTGQLAELNVTLRATVPPLPSGRPAEVAMSAEQLDIIARNLIQNSMKALARKGGGTIEVASTYLDHLPDLGASPTGGWIILTVRDDGPGIEPQFRESVANAGVTLDVNGGGLGWGLHLVGRLVESVGGSWRIDTRIAGEEVGIASFTEFELA
ncbi:MAG: ATP-binding protein, partial [Aeromicrobium sp.]